MGQTSQGFLSLPPKTAFLSPQISHNTTAQTPGNHAETLPLVRVAILEVCENRVEEN